MGDQQKIKEEIMAEKVVQKLSVWDLLRKRYPENQYALMHEVSDKPGFDRKRSADYVAVNLWPSRGLAIEGIELKSFRSDWLNELKNTKKAEAIFQYCDLFWLLTTDDKVAKIEEIPPTWGWLCIKGSRIVIMKAAPNLTPKPLDKNFSVCMLKRASSKEGWVKVDTIQERIEAARKEGYDKADKENHYRLKEADELKQRIKDFEAASGLSLRESWNNDLKKLGQAIRYYQNGGVADTINSIKQIQTNLSKLLSSTQVVMEELEKSIPITSEQNPETE